MIEVSAEPGDRGDARRAALGPLPGGRRALQPDRLHAPARGRAWARLRRRLRRRCGAGRSTSSRISGPRSGTRSCSAPRARTSACSAPDDARRPVVPRRPSELRREPARRQARRRGSRSTRLRFARAGELTWGELREQVGRTPRRCGSSASGRATGSRPTAELCPRRPMAFLATASLGAIWSSCSPDFGAGSVVDRFAQIEPKVLFAVDGYRYNGRDFDRRDVVAGLLAEMPTRRARRRPPLPRSRARPRRRSATRSPGTSCSPAAPAEELALRAGAVRPSRSGSSTPPAPRGCRRRSSRATAGSCSSSSRSITCTSTPSPATASSGSRPPAG